MKFYQELSRYYDEIFRVDASEMHFINNLLPKKATVLDIGCATGNKTVLLSDYAAQVDAFDLNEEMIERAKKNNSRSNINYFVADMLNMKHSLSSRNFDAILCLGNTLVHAHSADLLLGVMKNVADLLKKHGLFILQILNYDRIINENITILPLIDTEHVRFTRGYAWKDTQMHFVTTIEIKQKGEILHNDIVLYPLMKKELSDLLQQVGLTQIHYYGDYQGGPYQSGSFVTIACCQKE